MMKRDACLKVLARHVGDGVVVATYQSAFDWMAIAPRDLNYLCIGAMGQASSHALGLALGRPDKRVVVLDGDGSLLMNLGALVTIADQAPKNLYHFVSFNGRYEVNGDHPLPAAERLELSGFARAAGYAVVTEFFALEDFETRVAELLAVDGPVFATLHVERGEEYPRDYTYVHGEEARRRFKRALDASPTGDTL